MQTITTQSLINKLANFNPASSFVTISYTTTSSDHNRGAWGSRKKADKRDFEILKTATVQIQVGSDYETRLNNKLKKEGQDPQKEFAKAWYSMVSNTLAVKKSDPNSFYIRGFETKKLEDTIYHDEDGKVLTNKELEPYAKEKKESSNPLIINVLGLDKINTITFLNETYTVE